MFLSERGIWFIAYCINISVTDLRLKYKKGGRHGEKRK